MNRTDKWEYLYDKTQQLSKPFSLDNLLSDKEIINLEKSVINILNIFLDRGELHKGIKVYVDKILKNEIVQKMVTIRPRQNESLKEWTNKIFGEDKFGIVFNSLEAYDNKIGEDMCSIVAPLIKKAGLPLGGLSFLFFMGNYGFTPFGIHKEAIGEEGFLFHLGPAKKEFYAWDDEKLNTIKHNTIVFHDEINKMLPSSKKYILNPGSLMFIPHQVYHIANSEEFSLSIVMDYINPSKNYLEKKLATEIINQELSHNERNTYLEPIKNNNKDKNSFNYLDAESIMTKFRDAFDKKVLMLKSNGGLLKQSIKNKSKVLPNNEFRLKGKKVFPIYLLELDKTNTIIFARGNEIIKKSNPNLVNIISSLNKGEILTFEFLKNNFSPEWDLIEIYSFVNDLLTIEAIEIIEVKTSINKIQNVDAY